MKNALRSCLAAGIVTVFTFTANAFYDPEVGRFLQRDPIGENGGINLYEYVDNNPINDIDPLGLAVYIHYRPIALTPGGTFNHTSIVLEPDNPSDFAGNWLFYGTNGQLATLGGEPGGYLSGPLWDPYGDLIATPDWPGDSPGTGQCSSNNNLAPVPLPPGMTDTQFIQALIDVGLSYKDDQPYFPVPAAGPGYNSNSYTSGVIRAAGGTPPSLPVRAPGYYQPLPF